MPNSPSPKQESMPNHAHVHSDGFPWRWLAGSVVLAWLAFCVAVFYLPPRNRPFLTVVYPSLVEALGQWRLSFPSGFWIGLLCEGIVLVICWAIGWRFLRLCVQLPRWLEWTCAPLLGIGLVNLPLMFLAILNLLNVPAIILVFTLMIGGISHLLHRVTGPSRLEISLEAAPLATAGQRIWFGLGALMLGLLTLLSFYHALFYPVDYWDALILYVHYGKLTYEQGGFPVLVCLQVGLGLGANYPHLYPLHQAVTAMLFGQWNDLYAQILPPLAGLISILVTYALSVFLFRSRLIAVYAALSFRAIPFVTSYFIWASDYALVMACTSLWLLFLAIYLREPTVRSLQPLLLVSTILPHINYLGWIVWPPLAVALLWVWHQDRERCPRIDWIALSGGIWFLFALSWYVRNWLVTGNPVYAFFPEIFGGRNINLEVLASAQQEWMAHGNGMAGLGDTLWERLLGTPNVLLFDWRLAPLVAGILLPAFFLGWKKHHGFFLSGAVLLGLYWLYQYVISGLYLYHTIAVFPILAIYAAGFLARLPAEGLRQGFYALILCAAIAPGLSFSLMGTKHADPNLRLFARPGIEAEQYYRIRYPQASQAWRWVNDNAAEDALILTHDNRYHVYRQDIALIHLDDCELTPWYDKPYPEVHQELLRRGVDYYFQIPGEFTHPITQRLGHRAYLDNEQYFERILQAGDTALYRLVNPERLND